MRINWFESVGKTINGFEILEVKREGRRTMVTTICPYCKKVFVTRAEHIKKGKSCGCRKRYNDLAGKKFGMLTVVKPTEKRGEKA